MDTYLNVAGQVKDIRQHKLDQAVTIGYSTFAGLFFLQLFYFLGGLVVF